MSGKLVVKQALGLNANVKNCLTFVDDHSLAYVCGHQVVIANTELREQAFILATNTYQHQSLGFTAIAACQSKKIIAVAEKVDPSAIVTFYDAKTLRRKKVLANPDLGSKEVKCMVFSEDGKYLLTQGGGPEWNLVLWHVEKAAKALCSTKISLSDDCAVNQISFCPWDKDNAKEGSNGLVILVLGRNILRLFHFKEGQLRPLSITMRRDQANFISHCWLPDDTLIVGTEAGELLVIEGNSGSSFEFRGHINPSKADGEEAYPALCLHPSGRGFIMGSLHGEIKIFDKHEDVKEKYLLEDAVYIPGDQGHILEFAVGAEDLLVAGTSKHQLLSCSLSNLNNVKEGSAAFEHVFAPFHTPSAKGESEITGIDVALWKAVVVTCSRDRTVRIWNPADRRVELMKEFDEEPLGVSVHPSGIYCAVMFADKIRILTLLLEEIYVSREISARQVSYIKFSKGGHYLAAANGANLQIYQTYTGTTVATLRGHNNRIRSVIWLNYDSQLMTIGAEGAVYYWDLFPVAKRAEHYPGNVPIFTGAGPADGSSVFIATHDKLVKELTFGRADAAPANPSAATHAAAVTDSIIVKASKTIDLHAFVEHMIFDESRRMVLMGTNNEDGPSSVAVTMALPTLGGGGSTALVEMNAMHSAPITAMCLSCDGSTVYSGDASGCIIISEFENSAYAAAKSPAKQRDGIVAFEFVEEVVIHKSDLESRKAQITQLTQSVEELNQNNEHQMRLKELEHKDRLKEITDKFMTQLKAERMKYEELESEKRSIERDFDRKVKGLEQKHAEELKAIEFKYKAKQNAEENRHKQLIEETEDAHRRWNEENEVLVRSHQQYLQDLTLDYERRLSSEQHLQRELQVVKERQQVQYEQVKNETEMDGDREIAEMKIRYDAKLKAEEEMAQQLIAAHTVMTKNHETLAKEFSSQKQEIKRLKEKEQRLYETIHTLEKDIQSHKKEIREREETITDKEKRIFDLKKKNQELEKFRFVLDYKIKELKLQIAPRENEINTMRKQIEEMNLELEQYQKSNQALTLMIEELKLKMEGIRSEFEFQDERCAISERFMDKFRRDIQELWTQRSEVAAFKANMIRMYRVYVQEDVSPAMMGDTAKKRDLEDPQQVYNRDREQMERSLDSLRRAMKTEAVVHRRDLSKMMRESVLLTKELNALRKTGRYTQLQKKAIDQVGDLNNNAAAAGNNGTNSSLSELMDLLGIDVKAPPAKDKAPSQPAAGKDSAGGGLTMSRSRRASHALGPPPRSAALRTTSADGMVNHSGHGEKAKNQSRQDQWEAWREIQMQYDAMKQLEDNITAVCQAINVDPIPLIVAVDAKMFENNPEQMLGML